MNDLGEYAHIFDDIPAWRGTAPPGYAVDFLGTLTAKDFLQTLAEQTGPQSFYRADLDDAAAPKPPALGGGRNGERWFEAVGWITAAREASDRFLMMSLGAFYGYQAVRSQRALQLINPMPYKLVCAEPLAEKMAWVRRHMRDNGIDPEQQWLIETALGGSNDAVLFPVGAPAIGGHNCIATNQSSTRQEYLDTVLAQGRAKQALAELLLRNSTGITKNLLPGSDLTAEIRFVSCMTLRDLLGPFQFVDYIEADLQQSEIVFFPPYMDLLRQRVRRVHIGTHGADVHQTLHRLFEQQGWTIVFSYPPESTHDSPAGPFTTQDGLLTVRNPDL
jgi:hypothetical protein